MNPQAFIGKVEAFAHKEELWQRGDSILVAVSGGPDSLGLLYFLKTMAQKEGLRLGCCCVNHHLRPEAGEEAAHVETIAKSLDIPFYLRHVDVKKAQQEGKGSLETVARELRYEALRQVKGEGNFQWIAVAHHADDQAETILFHLLRGSGSRGLSGIQPKRGDLIRPFLEVTKKEIEEFLQTFSCKACHDATNDIPDTSRNKIRLRLLPKLLSYNPNLVASLGHTAAILREEDKYLQDLARAWLQRWAQVSRGGCRLLPRKELQQLPLALARRVLLEATQETTGESLDFQGLERLRLLALQGTSGQKTSGSLTMGQVEGPDFFLYPGTTKDKGDMDTEEVLELLYKKWMHHQVDYLPKTAIIENNEEQERLGPWQMTVQHLSQRPSFVRRNQYVLDEDKVGTLHLSYPTAQDHMAPWGMEGKKSIFRLLQEAHVPSVLRKAWPLVSDENHIYWTGLLRGSRYGRPTADTTRFLCITLQWIGKETKKQNGKLGKRCKNRTDH